MNHYGQLLQNQHRIARPTEHAAISDPKAFFTEIGEQVQSQITELRDQLLGSQRPGETLEDYRLRSYQAQATAEEMVLADQHLTTPESDEDEDLTIDDDPAVASYYLRLAMIDQALADTSSQAS
ncbi:MAG TPA: hypothetical protein VNQ73_01370 [Ilumatobacter sp.]|nr:hypothetical protein [Ilumatobacter sp.]